MKTLLSATPSPNKKDVIADVRSGNRIYSNTRTNELNNFKSLPETFNQRPADCKTKPNEIDN